MRKKRIPLEGREDYDVLSEFNGAEDTTDDADFLTDRGKIARSAGFTIGMMILTAVAFALGVAWGTRRDLPTGTDNPISEMVLHVGFVLLCGLLAAAIVLALGALAVGIPYARSKMAESRARSADRRSSR